ncbi:MAG TPA: di-heme oxidoredictase family protein [Isosphaeraceae bacterium]|jgi:CxxC motif-containing protein (DUF1111 family)|nr:di-heme oxidoredictase family protein [Isosphaeraceae bacterium]
MSQHRAGIGAVAGGLLALGTLAWIVPMASGSGTAAGEGADGGDVVGRELFLREWIADDPRAHDGDGLGPVYNDTSCVACHNLGGPGGGGPATKNVELLTAPAEADAIDLVNLARVHRGFRGSRSVVLHQFGTDREYDTWRWTLLGHPPRERARLLPTIFNDRETDRAEDEIARINVRMGPLARLLDRGVRFGGTRLLLSRRNPPPLFGTGLIDAIPDAAIEAGAKRQDDFPEVHGRVSRLKGGRIGRFGWKAQIPDLREFVFTACANELGLEVPDHHQAIHPLNPEAQAKGFDLTADECERLVAFVRGLRGPEPAPTVGDTDAILEAGRDAFATAGCVACHLPKLGPVEGVYSDLLLHDMGRELSDAGSYYSIAGPDSPGLALAQEWRTPPLWGFRDSGPYLHDGRARTLDEAVAQHGGEATASAVRYFKLPPKGRQLIQTFLRSLAVPAQVLPARAD